MKAIRQFSEIDKTVECAVVIADFDCEHSVDPDWPEVILCDDYESAELLKNTLNAISFRDCDALLRSDEPFLSKDEVAELWVTLKAARYTVEPISDELLLEHGHRYLPSLKVLHRLLPELLIE